MWNQFKSIIWPIIDIYVPTKFIPHNKKFKVKQYPKHIKKLLTRKAAIWRTFKTNKSQELKIKYTDIANRCRLEILKHDREKEERILKANNLGTFYKYVNKKISSKTGVAPLKDPQGNLIISDLEKANLLNDYFQSAFTVDDGSVPSFPSRTAPENQGLNDIEINPTIVQRVMSKAKNKFSAGPDNLPPIFLRNTSSTLSFPLAILFRSFFDLKNLPSEWKHSIITPKFKKGDPSAVSNYRPIALTCVCSKIFESILSNELLSYLTKNDLITKHQHAFLKKHSTITNSLESLYDWTISFSNKKSVNVAYIDFCRAFDTISHPKLIQKLSAYGVRGTLLSWINDFLSHRTQTVKIGSQSSHSVFVTSGVPQGSVLGPILFLLFINDIADFTSPVVVVSLFADDLKIYTEISHPDAEANLQSHLNHIQQWATTWQMKISHEKSNIFKLNCSSNTQYFFENQPINQIDSVKDLGILFEPNLKFHSHIHNIVSKAKQRASLIHRSFLSRDVVTLKRAFVVYVRPLLEYSAQVWSPSLITLINEIEKVQKIFTERLPGLQNLNYCERLQILKLKSLEHRRLIIDLVTCYNIIHNNIIITRKNFFTFSTSTNLRGHPFRLSIPIIKNNTHRSFFSVRIIRIWNALPTEIVTAKNINIFKSRLNQLDLSKFLIGPSYSLCPQ